ncbi:SGNH/GDSL hydrolase family protein [Nocardioides jiangxiensis]|uniref:SGNH/GDSL hydrolase family protein n=1 Tax=Nocardioides jiangxiensis TaxID=3064524 RepID=A0ABT9B0F8_9ACTN|nr:SGNH/GDSL hydrolase family protein [Nocardioides sp. WY-20]MDO7868339.1 SGNH/GDSL hydrolase family protein [Nocardioides sp. WY-20]
MRTHSIRRRLAAAAVAAASTALLAVPGASPANATDPLTMVALGDSSAAGPLVGSQSSWDCLRSTSNWPAVAARTIGAQLTDVTCSGATTADITAKRYGYIPAQVDAVQPDTDIVTLAIGANDINLGGTVPSCMQPLPYPAGVSCKSWMTANGDPTDAQLAAVAPKVAADIQAIRAKAPAAQIYLVGYLRYWDATGCYPIDPIWDVDAQWLQTIFDRTNAMLRTTATANGATYVDIATPSTGHGVCAPLASKWVEGFIPTSQAAPYHPNQMGMDAAGAVVASAIG